MRLRSKNHYTQCSAGNWKEYPVLQNILVGRLFNGFSISVNLSPVFRRELVPMFWRQLAGLVVDQDPPRSGLQKQINSAIQDLSGFKETLHRDLSIEKGVLQERRDQ